MTRTTLAYFVLFEKTGVATGSISSLVNIAQNDIAPERKRLKYQGVQGASVAIGSITDMMAGGALATANLWPTLYYVEIGLSILTTFCIYHAVPANCQSPKKAQVWKAIKTIDFVSFVSGTPLAACGLLLLSQYASLSKSLVSGLGAITGVSGLIFFAWGLTAHRRQVRPIIPFRLFRNRTVDIILLQNILLGMSYHTLLLYLPVNLQVVRAKSPIIASAYQIAYHICHGKLSFVSGVMRGY